MLKNLSRLEHKVNERIYQFYCDMDAPIDDVKNALFNFNKFVGQVEDAHKVQQAQVAEKTSSSSEESSVPEIKSEEKEV